MNTNYAKSKHRFFPVLRGIRLIKASSLLVALVLIPSVGRTQPTLLDDIYYSGGQAF